MDFVFGGVAACFACFFTNPLEVVKTRMQLQGELQSRGTYQVYYRNVFHAFYTIGKIDGLAGLQKGLVPGLVYQFCMNGVRLGSYAIIESLGYIHTDGRVSATKSIASGAIAGVVGAVMGSPIYLVSTENSLRLCLVNDGLSPRLATANLNIINAALSITKTVQLFNRTECISGVNEMDISSLETCDLTYVI